jgi:Malic enzyme, NAD binding domain
LRSNADCAPSSTSPSSTTTKHGTAIVVLAALLNALRVVSKRAEDITVVIIGAGAAGLACADILLAHGVGDVIVCNRRGALDPADGRLDPDRAALAERTNKHHRRGTADEMLEGADLLLGLSGPGAVSAAAVRRMAPDAIVFAMANPVPEIHPEEIDNDVAIIATGRSDYPNQINNVLAFPGVFKGALEVRARTINEPMKLAAAHAIASVIAENELDPDYIIPSVFNHQVAESRHARRRRRRRPQRGRPPGTRRPRPRARNPARADRLSHTTNSRPPRPQAPGTSAEPRLLTAKSARAADRRRSLSTFTMCPSRAGTLRPIRLTETPAGAASFTLAVPLGRPLRCGRPARGPRGKGARNDRSPAPARRTRRSA